MKEKVLQWIQSGCNFNQGLNILAEIGKNKQLPRILAGNEKRNAGKLFYELCKAAGYSLKEYQELKEELQAIVEKLNQSVSPEGDSPLDPPASSPAGGNPPVGDNSPAQVPESVEKVIKEHADLFKLRAQLHEQMAGLPEDNNDDTVKKRKNLSDSIALINPRIDLMFAAREAFYTQGILPDMAVLFPKPPEPNPEPENKLPSNPDELKKIKKNLQSANTKDQNMLEYQGAKKGEKPNPMQPGPKRQKIEERIKERNAQIEKIDFALLSCS